MVSRKDLKMILMAILIIGLCADKDKDIPDSSDDSFYSDDFYENHPESNSTNTSLDKKQKKDKDSVKDPQSEKNEETLIVKGEEIISVFGKDGKMHSVKIPSLPSDIKPMDETGIIKYNITYQLDKERVTYQVPEDLQENEFYLMEITGEGMIKIEIFADNESASKATVTRTIELSALSMQNLIIFGKDYLGKKGQILKMQAMESFGAIQFWTCNLIKSTSLDLTFNNMVRVYTLFTDEIKVKVLLDKSDAEMNENNRYQFLVDTSLEEHILAGDERIAMHVNVAEKDFPTKKKFEYKASANSGSGLLKTFNKNSDGFCKSIKCEYFVTIFVKDIESVRFFPNFMKNGSKIIYEKTMMWLEEIESDEVVNYEIVTNFPKAKSFVISFTPLDNFVTCRLSVGKLPKNDNDYQFEFALMKREDLYITELEFEKMEYPNNRIYVQYSGKKNGPPGASMLNIHVIESGNLIKMTQNSLIHGPGFDGELINYFVDFSEEHWENVEIGFSLTVKGGEGIILSKECTENEPECTITESDISEIVKKRSTGEVGVNGIKFSTIEKANGEFNINTFLLDFICLKKEEKVSDRDYFAVSKTCKYAMGVLLTSTHEDLKAQYRFQIDGGTNHVTLQERKSTEVKGLPETTTYYKIGLNTTAASDFDVQIELYVLTGSGVLFISNEDPYPTDDSFLQKIEIDHTTNSYLETKKYNITLKIKASKVVSQDQIYMALQTDTFSVIDIMVTTKAILDQNWQYENINPEKNYQRSITGDNSFLNDKQETVYYQNYRLDLLKLDMKSNPIQNFEININSEIFGLKICIYYYKEFLDLATKCDFESMVDYLYLTKKDIKLDPVKDLIISIQKTVDKSHDNAKLPIKFSVFTSINETQSNYELILPGSTLRGKISLDKNIKVLLNFDKMTTKGMMFLTTDDPELIVDIFKVTNDGVKFIASLKDEEFGLYIPEARTFKKEYCEKDCVISALIYTTSNSSLEYSLTFTYDDAAIVIKEGFQLRIPNNVKTYFIFRLDKISNLSMDVYAYATSMVAYSRVLNETQTKGLANYVDEINEFKFDLKSDIATSVQVVYSKTELEKKDGQFVLFLVEPKFNFWQVDETIPVNILTHSEVAHFYMRTDFTKLHPFVAVTDTISVGEFKYYLIQLTKESDFSIATQSVTGSVAIYQEKGMNIYPTVERYWKKSQSSSGDVIVTKKSEYVDELTSYAFIIGIYGNRNSSFSILFLPDFKNVIKVEFQKIIDMRMEEDKYYYLDYFDDKATFGTMLYCDDSDIEVSILDYDKSHGEDFMTKINNEASYVEKLVVKKGAVPLTEMEKMDSFKKSHIVIRLKALQSTAVVNFLIFDPSRAIEAPAEKRFQYAQDADVQTIFKVILEKSSQTVDLDVKLFFGNVSYSVSRELDKFTNYTLMDGSDQKYTVFEIKDDKNDIILYNTVYISILSKKYSKYSILVKPRNKFKRLAVGQPEIIYSNPEYDSYVFYELNSAMLKKTNSLDIEINSVSYYSERPEMLFLDSDEFDKKSGSSYLPMPILDFEEKNLEELRQTIYEVRPLFGFYVIKIAKNPNKYPIKVSIIANKIKTIEENGLYRGVIKQDNGNNTDTYSLYLSEAGEFRLVLEACSDLSADNLDFDPSLPGQTADLKTNILQSYSYILIDETNSTVVKELRSMYYPVVRGIIPGPGFVSFTINKAKDPKRKIDVNSPNLSYALMSEFKPANKELILKDYIEIFKDEQAFRSFYVYYDFVQSQSQLRLTIRMPMFKLQLLDDYPNLEKVRLTFKVYLFSETSFITNVELCGLSSLEYIKKTEKVISVEFLKEQILNDKRNSIEVFFNQADLDEFKTTEHLNVLCYVSARFFENEDEEWQVTMDLKYTNVPYFFLTIKNKYITKEVFKLILFGIITLLIFLMILVFLFILKKKRKRSDGIMRPRDQDSSDATINVSQTSQSERQII